MLVVKIQNDGTGTAEIGNYRAIVMVNDKVIASAVVKKFKRRMGWRLLLTKVIVCAEDEK